MKFYSTKNRSKPVDFKTALLRGLAEDGGLYMPSEWPKATRVHKVGKVHQVLKEFIDIPEKELEKICSEAFNFEVPLVKLDKNLHILELFHGPTLSFKDFGARFMARAMNYYLRKSGEKFNIIVATSGDTGSAVADGFYGLSNIKVFVLYPSKRISALQEKQIATLGKNIIALEVAGDFDDCQRLAKQALGDPELRKKINLSSANSINIGRLLPQMYYYFLAGEKMKKPIFVVPSGNFGNLTAGLFTKKLGLPVKKFIAGINVNSGIPEFLKSGYLAERHTSLKLRRASKTKMTYSSAMDVSSPSNWARVIDLYKNSPELLKKDLEAITISESETKKTITEIYKKFGYVADPHTAVGIAAAMTRHSTITRNSDPYVVLATAHPAKFPEIVESAIGKKIGLPQALAGLVKKKKQSVVIGKNYKELRKILDSNH